MIVEEILAADQIGFPILSLIAWLPLVAALAITRLGDPARARSLAMAAIGIEAVLVIAALTAFRTDTAAVQLAEHAAGFYRLGIDGLSVLFLPLTAFLTLLCVIADEPRVRGDARQYYAAILALCGVLMGAFAAADAVLFWIFISLEAVPAWLLIRRFGVGEARDAVARDYAILMAISSALMLVGIELLAGYAGGRSIVDLAASGIPAEAQGAIFLLLCIALGLRAPVFPMHGWLPRVLEHGPLVGVGVFLVGLKVGTYGFLRFVIAPMPEASTEWGWIMAVLGAVGAVYGGLIALMQSNLRRLLAYASLSHMGVILIGIFSLNGYGIQGGLLQMLSIGTAVAGLYLLSGFIHTRVGAPTVSRMGDLVTRAPVLSGAFLLIALGAVGFPGTSGFNGEHLVVIGAYKLHWLFAMATGASVVLTAAYFLRFFQRAFMAPRHGDEDEMLRFVDLNGRERVVAGAVVAIVLFAGLYTGPFIAMTGTTVEALGAWQTAETAAPETEPDSATGSPPPVPSQM